MVGAGSVDTSIGAGDSLADMISNRFLGVTNTTRYMIDIDDHAGSESNTDKTSFRGSA